MKEISLSNGGYAMVDDGDFDFLSKWKWTRSDRNGVSYATRNRLNSESHQELPHTIYMHRAIIKVTDPSIEVDHIDRNGLNNQKNNLRPVSSTINQHNTRIRSDNTSGYRGVTWSRLHRKWVARIRTGGKTKHLGLFESASEASEAYAIALNEIKERYNYE